MRHRPLARFVELTGKGRSSEVKQLGIIAGSGPLPLIATREAKAAGFYVSVVGIREETDSAVEALADRVTWVRMGQLGALLKAFKRDGVTEAVMVGKVRMSHLFTGRVRPDARGALLFLRLSDRSGDSIMEGVANELAREGITLIECTRFLGPVLARKGVLTRRPPTKTEWEDIRLGREVARTVARLRIGQTVIVKRGTILAIEAIEGTDAAIRRGAQLGKGGVVVVKTSRPGHDLRFDLPVIGPDTVRVLTEVTGTAIAVEADKTILIEPQETLAMADRARITIVAE